MVLKSTATPSAVKGATAVTLPSAARAEAGLGRAFFSSINMSEKVAGILLLQAVTIDGKTQSTPWIRLG
jgi:hypothetical protein